MPEKYNSDGEKHCNNCKAYHPHWMFGKNKNAYDGLTYSCRKSINEIKVPSLAPAVEPSTEPIVIPVMPEDHLMSLKLLRPYKYSRPDAYDMYINNINSARK